MKKIYQETVNHNIIEFLKEKGFQSFYEDFENLDSKEYYVEMNIDGYSFEVMIEIERSNNTYVIFKDRKYYGIRNSNEQEFSIMRRSATSKNLQVLFNKWLDDYFKWESSEQSSARYIEETNQILNLKNR